MATMQHTFLAGCCGRLSQCCSGAAGVWYLCLAIIVMVMLISCNDLLKSRCIFIGLPWSKSKLYYVHTDDEDVQLLLVLDEVSDDLKEQSLALELTYRSPTPPPPYYSLQNTDETTLFNQKTTSYAA